MLKRLFVCLIIVGFILTGSLILSLSGCNVKKVDKIPFFSFSFYNERDKNSVFLNYWDVESGKVYLNEKRLYIGYRRGVNTDILPYFWDGKGNMYLNCLLKKKDKSINPIVSNISSYSQERFYSFSDEKEVFYVDLKDDVLKIYKQENEDIILTKTFQISHLLPKDILPGQKPLPLYLFKEDDKMWIIIDYLSKNMIYEDTLTEKFFIYRIEGDSIKFIKIKGIDNFSLNFLVSEEVFKKIAKDNKYIYIPLCLKDMCGRVCKINLDTGEVSFLNSKEENLPPISFVGIYNDFLIVYTRYEIFALKDGRVVGKILISKDGKNLTVYKGGRITQRREIKNPYPDIMFPNTNSPKEIKFDAPFKFFIQLSQGVGCD